MQNTVRFKNIPERYRKFLITTIFARRALAWPHYDADVHCCGSYVIWKLSETRKVRSKCISVLVASDASQKNDRADVERGRKQKRELLKDKSAVRKARRNRGQSYSPLRKKGKENRMPKRQIKSTCDNCRNNSTQVISDEERNAIFSNYWQYGDLTKQQHFIVVLSKVKMYFCACCK